MSTTKCVNEKEQKPSHCKKTAMQNTEGQERYHKCL